MLLCEKNAIITGANRGIGRAIVDVFAANGANIWAHSRRETTSFVDDMKMIAEQYGVQIWPIFFDITDSASMHAEIKIIHQSKLPVDILVNNAGIIHNGMFHVTPLSVIREIFEVNFFAQMGIMQAVSRLMGSRKTGSIVNVASIAGLDSYPGNSAYGTSKAALIAATRCLAAEFAPLGIRVNAIAPGLTNTDMANQLGPKAERATIDTTTMKRIARAEEIADAVLFFASNKSTFVTGQVLRVDGGKM